MASLGIPPPLYEGLDETRREIRLLKVLAGTSDAQIIHCRLETCSLDDISPDYEGFESVSGPTDYTGRELIARWTTCHVPEPLASSAPLKRTNATKPASMFHRFKWGDFAALSYVWGNPGDTRPIRLNDRHVRVTANLESALREFRQQGEFDGSFLLWVDALCINQEDLDERARQIRRMRDIYESAWTVISWLGEEGQRSDLALQLVRDLATFDDLGCVEEVEEMLRMDPHFFGKMQWMALQDLMDRPYWFRLWVIQEIIMGSTATWIRCGRSMIEWTTFCAGIAALQKHLWLVKDWCLRSDVAAKGQGQTTWMTSSLHLVYQDLAPLSKDSSLRGDKVGFGRLLDLANSAGCSNQRDKIYSLVGLMPAAVAVRLQPDYTLPVAAVYASTTRAFIEALDTLEPLREGNPWGPCNGPSWVADWLWRGRIRHSRPEAPLWVPSYLFSPEDDSAHIPYNAAGDTKHDSVFSDDGLMLSCTGFIADRITGLSAREVGYFHWDSESISAPKDWLSIYGDWPDTAEALCRTLVADRVQGSAKAAYRHMAIFHLPSTFQSAVPQFSRRGWSFLSGQEGYYFRWEGFRAANRNFPLGDLVLGDFFDNDIPPGASEFDYTEVYSCFDRTAKKRRLMTTERGYIGWAPDNMYGEADEQVMPGDLIAIIFGCSTPLAIRPRGSYFQVLGEAYVQGLMDGEAIEDLRKGTFHTQRFIFA
ncbi:HET-domain-containing protein [Polyplosphaeria fusca]|uniref:HET-domain-containing protein n=1 Tax=Polyplosphaeria fusca TaxID=682080 RepID=A0A9P4V4R2_9PLEO|nr:HET-domain-containing protein [Polyplosphaeria fusca]